MFINFVCVGATMIQKTFTVREKHGIHARPAARIVQTCQGLNSQITLCYGCQKADGCSILDLLLLATKEGSQIEVIVEGGNEKDAISKITELFESGSGI